MKKSHECVEQDNNQVQYMYFCSRHDNLHMGASHLGSLEGPYAGVMTMN